MKKSVVFYFPWKELSGGPVYLSNLANGLAKLNKYDVYYVDYIDGVSHEFINATSVTKIKVSEGDFSIDLTHPVAIILPIYFAPWLPKLHEKSNIVFINWHMCSLGVLSANTGWKESDMSIFLTMVNKTRSVFFADKSHWLGQKIAITIPCEDYVPICLPVPLKEPLVPDILNNAEINIAVLGRLCDDKIYSIINLLDNLQEIKTDLKKNLVICGDGPSKNLIQVDQYNTVNIHFAGVIPKARLDSFLLKKADIVFAMGTSVLESAKLGLPSVIIPHNMKPFTCDDYVYLYDSVGFSLGWYDDQIEEMGLQTCGLGKIISDIYINGKKDETGIACYEYFISHHSIENSAKLLKSSIERTSLTVEKMTAFSVNTLSNYRAITFLGLVLLSFKRVENNCIAISLFGRLRIASARHAGLGARIVCLKDFPLLYIRKTPRFCKVLVFPYFMIVGYRRFVKPILFWKNTNRN